MPRFFFVFSLLGPFVVLFFSFHFYHFYQTFACIFSISFPSSSFNPKREASKSLHQTHYYYRKKRSFFPSLDDDDDDDDEGTLRVQKKKKKTTTVLFFVSGDGLLLRFSKVAVEESLDIFILKVFCRANHHHHHHRISSWGKRRRRRTACGRKKPACRISKSWKTRRKRSTS